MEKNEELLFLDKFYQAEKLPETYRKYKRKREKWNENLLDDMETEESIAIEVLQEEKRKFSSRTKQGMLLLFFLAPLTILFGILFLRDRKYMVISLLLVVYAMLPFLLSFEGRKPKAREIMVLAVLAALTVAGRSAFFMLPNFKPVAAMVIISGVAFGPEAGFLVGALSIVVSNFLFGQGPWTPWQMLSYGLIGFVAGCLFQKRLLKKNVISMCIYGFFSVVFIFGGIMNPASLIMSTGTLTWQGVLSYYISGLPVDMTQAASTVIFLWIGAKPMLEKLERIRKKYGLVMY